MKNRNIIIVVLIVAFIITGCNLRLKDNGNGGSGGGGNGGGSGKLPKNATEIELLDTFVAGFNERNYKKALSVMPDFYQKNEKYSDMMKKEIDGVDEHYGKDAYMYYEYMGKSDVDDGYSHFCPTTSDLNAKLKEWFDDYVPASQCYDLEGGLGIKGSLDSFYDGFEGYCYCDFNGTWRLIIG